MADERVINESPQVSSGRVATDAVRARLQTLPDWRHVEVKVLPGSAPRASMLVGPAIGETAASVSEGFGGVGEGAGSSDSRLHSGIACLAGRWVIPTTRRIRGITRGGIQLPDLGGGGGDGDDSGGGGSESGGLMGPPGGGMSGGGGGESGTLIVSSDARCDIVCFLGTAPSATLRLMLRGWKSGFAGPDDAEASEVPTSLVIRSGSYCVVTTDTDKRMQPAVAYPWMLAPGATQRHPPDVIEVVVRLNAQIKARGLVGSMKLLPVPSLG